MTSFLGALPEYRKRGLWQRKHHLQTYGRCSMASLLKNLPAMQETWVWSLGQEDPLDKKMIIHSIIPAWKIPQRSLTGYSQHTLSHFSRVRLFATPWTVASRLLCPWDSPGKNTGVGCHFLLQGIFWAQGSNPGLLHCRQTLYPLSHQGSPIYNPRSPANKC